jgi:hypothetical protein
MASDKTKNALSGVLAIGGLCLAANERARLSSCEAEKQAVVLEFAELSEAMVARLLELVALQEAIDEKDELLSLLAQNTLALVSTDNLLTVSSDDSFSAAIGDMTDYTPLLSAGQGYQTPGVYECSTSNGPYGASFDVVLPSTEDDKAMALRVYVKGEHTAISFFIDNMVNSEQFTDGTVAENDSVSVACNVELVTDQFTEEVWTSFTMILQDTVESGAEKVAAFESPAGTIGAYTMDGFFASIVDVQAEL